MAARGDEAKAIIGRQFRMDRFESENLCHPIRRQVKSFHATIKYGPLLRCKIEQFGFTHRQGNHEAIGQPHQQMQKPRFAKIDQTRGVIDDDSKGGRLSHWMRGPRISSSIAASGRFRSWAARTGEISSSASAR